MKLSRRILGLVVVMLMLVAMVPAVSAAEETPVTYGAAIGLGTDAVQNGQYLAYGDNTWFVMDNSLTTTDEKGLSLISDKIVEKIQFNKGGLSNDWATSDAKAWIAAYAEDTFSAAELAGIMATSKDATAGSYFGANWSKDALAGEKLFFLSAAEVYQYFYDDVNGLVSSLDGVNQGWWIRSAYTDRDILGGIVSDSGYVGAPGVSAAWGARPAFNIAESSVAISSAAVGGKQSGAVGADALIAVVESTSNTAKLTVISDAYASFNAVIGDGSGTIEQTIDYTSWTLPIQYSGALTGANEFVSVLITNQTGSAVYYGHIANNSESGTVEVNMPAGLSGKYTVHVLAEQVNGDNATDFGSALVSADIVISDGISRVDSWGLILEGDIRADFLMELDPSVISDASASVKVTVDDKTNTYKVSDLTANENGLYLVSANVAAAQMTEDICIQAVTSQAEGNIYRYSVRSYGEYILANNNDENVLNLVKAMLNYGGKAQEYFQYNIGVMADDGIYIGTNDIPYVENLAATKSGSSENVTYYGSSLVHEHMTSLRFYFKSTDEAINKVTFSTAGNADMTVYKTGDLYYVEISDIAPQNLCNDITVTVDGFSVTYSPFHYIHRMYFRDTTNASLRDLMYAMYNYYYYANQYLA